MDRLAIELREKLLSNVSKEDLLNFCQVDDVNQSICDPNNDSFWKRRVRIDYGEIVPIETQTYYELWYDLTYNLMFRYAYAWSIYNSTNMSTKIRLGPNPTEEDMLAYRQVIPWRISEYLGYPDTRLQFSSSYKVYFDPNEVRIVLYPRCGMTVEENASSHDEILDFLNTGLTVLIEGYVDQKLSQDIMRAERFYRNGDIVINKQQYEELNINNRSEYVEFYLVSTPALIEMVLR